MREHIVSRRVLSACAVLLLAIPIDAQQAVAPDAAQQRAMYQLQTFEAILQSAVKHGADVLARKWPCSCRGCS